MLFRLAGVALTALLQVGAAHAALLAGHVRDAVTHEGIGFCEVSIAALNRGVVAHADGEYHVPHLPIGEHLVRFSRIGYRTLERRITVAADDSTLFDVDLAPDDVQIGDVDILANSFDLKSDRTVVTGRNLQEQLATTVAGSLARQSGFGVRSMGPAPARPVSRGLGGPRLTVLEDGQATGDLSASSSDHAVAIDPLLAQSLDIVRGPAAYHYGSSVLGGVVNVERNALLRVEPHRASVQAQLQGEAATAGAGGSLAVSVPIRRLVFHGDGALRRAGDMRSAKGVLANTQSSSGTGSVGLSWIDRWGHAGVAYTLYETDYGLPGGFLGAHPQGVSVYLARQALQSRLAWHVPSGAVRDLEFEYSFTRVHQQEFESSGAVGVEFGLLTDQVRLDAHLHPVLGLHDARISCGGSLRDYETAAFSFTPDSRETEFFTTISASRHEHIGELSAALRSDWAAVSPDARDTSRVIGIINRRDFSGLSGALRIQRPLSKAFAAAFQLSRVYRTPQIEELFSEGPHLAAYSFEVGNPKLAHESGWGLEAQGHWSRGRIQASFAAFANRFEQFIYAVSTGRPSESRNDLEQYQYQSAQAAMFGSELTAQVDLGSGGDLSGQLSYVEGRILGHGHLPAIPPLTASLEYSRDVFDWRLAPRLVGALAQRNLGDFETATGAYLRADFGVSRYWMLPTGLTVLTVRADNLFDTVYLNHLSRVKTVVPEPGRSLTLTISVQF